MNKNLLSHNRAFSLINLGKRMGFHLIALQDQLMVMESYLPCPEQERPLRPIKISWYVKLDHSHANKAEF